MEIDKLLKMEEDLADAVYLYGIETAKEAMAKAQVLYTEKIGSGEGFDRWALFNVRCGSRPLLSAFLDRPEKLSGALRALAEAWAASDPGVYEAGDRPEPGWIWFSDVISGERLKAKAGEWVGKGDLIIGRLLRLEEGLAVSARLSVTIDRKLAETVKGKLRRAYEAYCDRFGYVAYRSYMEDNPWILPGLMAATEAAREISEEGVPDVHVRVYAMADRGRVLATVASEDAFVESDREKGVLYYLLMVSGAVLGEVEIHGRRLVLNANSRQEAEKADSALKRLLGDSVTFLEKRTESLEDVAGREEGSHVGV